MLQPPECFVFASAAVFVFLKSTCRLSDEFVGQRTNRAWPCQPSVLLLYEGLTSPTSAAARVGGPQIGGAFNAPGHLPGSYLQTKSRATGLYVTLTAPVEVREQREART